MIHRWEREFVKLDNPMKVSKFIRECRHRHAQSIKSFTIAYYNNSEDGNKIKQTKTEVTNDQGETSEVEGNRRTPQKIVDLVNKFTVHRYVDIKAMENSLRINTINKNYAEKIIKEISSVKNSDILLTIYKSYIHNLKDISSLCSNKFVADVKSIIRGKTSKTKLFKTSNEELLKSSLDGAKIYNEYKKLSVQSRYTYLNFVIFYLCWSLRNYVCHK
jgi:hypothetical protein